MPIYSFKLSAETVRAIRSSNQRACEQIAHDLSSYDDNNRIMMSAIDHYCTDDRGTPAECSLRIDPDTVGLAENGTGSLVIEFQEEAYYGCDDMNVLDDKEIDVEFTISFERCTLTITTPESSRQSYGDNEPDYD